MEDPTGVDVIGDLDLRHPPWRRRNARQVEPTQRDVVPCHGPLTLKDVNLHRRLAVLGRREDLVLLHWDGSVPVDEPGEDRTKRLYAQAQGGHIQKKDVLYIAREDSSLNGGSHGDALHGIHPSLGLPAYELLEVVPYHGHPSGTADEDHVLHVLVLPLGVLERLLDGAHGLGEDRLHQLLQLRPGQLYLKMDRLLSPLGYEGQVDTGGGRSGELYLRLLGGIPDPLHGVVVAFEVHALFLLESGNNVLDDGGVHVQAAEAGVPVGAHDLEDALPNLHQRDVEGPAPQVQDRDLCLALLVKPVGEGGGRGLVDQT